MAPRKQQSKRTRGYNKARRTSHQRSCQGKIKYPDHATAKAAALRTNHQLRANKEPSSLTPYRCDNCKQWHNGNAQPKALRILDSIARDLRR